MVPKAGAIWSVAGLVALSLFVAGAAEAKKKPKKKISLVRTEQREQCDDLNPVRNPYFGELHIHSAFSFDSASVGVRNGPREAYAFALGAAVDLPPYVPDPGNPGQDVATRSAQLRRPLDFTAVTDHAEYFGEVDICFTLPAPLPPDCQQIVDASEQLLPPNPSLGIFFFNWLIRLAIPNATRLDVCGPGGTLCTDRASMVWTDIQAAAEEFYDRSSSCNHTTFVAYEWTGTGGGGNIHRNVIFRNDDVPSAPTSWFETNTPQGLWAATEAQCALGPPGCDFLAIPHNSNVSQGRMFAPVGVGNTPLTSADAEARARYEPLVEIPNQKGTSECSLLVPAGITNDEECGFETLRRPILFGGDLLPGQTLQPLSFARNGLKEGLAQEQALGANPFKLGFVGGTDGHNGTPGLTREDDYAVTGHLGNIDRDPAHLMQTDGPGGIQAGPGGLTVLWALENSRDALFEAMRRREAYATSGTRPIVRFFGGWKFKQKDCKKKKFVKRAYKEGVPMGSDLEKRPKGVALDASPTFLVSALRDPGAPGSPGTALQRIQIVKGWLDASGATHEQVYDVAGDADNGADVDLATCTPTGPGFDSLCAVWEDPDFEPTERSFYYTRVLENPSCRWSTRVCLNEAVDCNAGAPPGLEACCDGSAEPTLQERAWTSPIWYRPEGPSGL